MVSLGQLLEGLSFPVPGQIDVAVVESRQGRLEAWLGSGHGSQGMEAEERTRADVWVWR